MNVAEDFEFMISKNVLFYNRHSKSKFAIWRQECQMQNCSDSLAMMLLIPILQCFTPSESLPFNPTHGLAF